MPRSRFFSILFVGFITAAAGCQQNSSQTAAPTAAVLSARAKYLLDQAPDAALGVKEAKATITEPSTIVLTGTIDAGEREPWEEGKALFLITESSIATHDHGDGAHDNCPFCNREKASNLALVKFVDDAGETVPIDARDLFGLEKGQQVVVQGTGAVDPSGTLVVTANGIYVKS